MRTFLSLIKVNVLSSLTNTKRNTKRNTQVNALKGKITTLLILGLAMIFFGATYAKMFGDIMGVYGGLEKLISTMLAISVFVNFFFSFYASSSSLFGYKDYDLLMSMPIKPSVIILSKFVAMYVSDLFFSLTITVPSFFVFSNLNGGIDANTVIINGVAIIFSPFLAIALSTVIGVIVSMIASLFRKKNIIQIILYFLLFVGIFAVSFSMGSASVDELALSMMTNSISKIYFILPLLFNAFNNKLYLLYYCLVNIGSFVLIFILVSIFYKKLNSILTAKRKVKNFKLKEYNGKNLNRALFDKEVKRIFSSPVYTINCLLGIVFGVVISVVIMIVFLTLGDEIGELSMITDSIAVFMPALLCFVLLLSPTTSCAVSMEGQAFWVVKTAPVKMIDLFKAKLRANNVFYIPSAIILSVMMVIGLKCSVFVAILNVVVAVLIATFGGNIGLLYNILFPKFVWTNEQEIVKQSLPIFLCMITSFVLLAVFGVLGYFGAFKLYISPIIILSVFAVLLLVANILIYYIIIERGETLLNKKI